MNEGLGFEPATAVDHLRASDETLARVMDTVGPFRLQPMGASSIFAALARTGSFIPYAADTSLASVSRDAICSLCCRETRCNSWYLPRKRSKSARSWL